MFEVPEFAEFLMCKNGTIDDDFPSVFDYLEEKYEVFCKTKHIRLPNYVFQNCRLETVNLTLFQIYDSPFDEEEWDYYGEYESDEDDGYYWIARMHDYGYRNIVGVFYKYNAKGYRDTEFYSSVRYTSDDDLFIIMPKSSNAIDMKKVQITGLLYDRPYDYSSLIINETVTKKTKSEIRIINAIKEERKKHIDKSQIRRNILEYEKLEYEKQYLDIAWKLYPELCSDFHEISKDLTELEIQYSLLLKHGVDRSSPKMDDDIIYIPIACDYSRRFFESMFLCREYSISNVYADETGILQYEVPVKATNTSMIMALYGNKFEKENGNNKYKIVGKQLATDIDLAISKNNYVFQLEDRINKSILCKTNNSIIRYSSIMSERIKLDSQKIEIINTFLHSSNPDARITCIKWVSEYSLYQYISILFPDTLYQYRSDWLGKQTLDIYIPTLNCAIEYQGKQHYESIDCFGGKDALKDYQERDRKKLEKCKANNINLFYWHYKINITFQNVLYFLFECMSVKQINNQFIASALEKESCNAIENIISRLMMDA